MQNVIKAAIVALVIALATPVAAQDIEAGYEAYRRGEFAAALHEFRPLAEQGDARAQAMLGIMYFEGWSVPEDDAEAAKWIRIAAEWEEAEAQFNLGMMYAKGEGVPEDDAEAAKWYRKAAEQGLSVAQYFLGYMYEFGEGVPQDDVAAYAWYSLAAASGDEDGRENRDSIKRKLTPSQIDRGQVMVRETSKRIEKRKAAKGE